VIDQCRIGFADLTLGGIEQIAEHSGLARAIPDPPIDRLAGREHPSWDRS
jgi:hypothetical protein